MFCVENAVEIKEYYFFCSWGGSVLADCFHFLSGKAYRKDGWHIEAMACGLQYFPRYPCASLCVSQRVVMVFQFVAAGFCHSLKLVVGQLSQFAPRCLQCVVKPVAGIFHLINTENSLQTPFVKKLVVSHQRQPFDKRFYLFPNFREYRGVIRVVVSETMHLAAPIIVIVRLGKDEGIKRIDNLAVFNYYDADTAHRTSFVVGSFKIYGLYFFGFPISKYASTHKNSKNAPNRRVFCSYNEIIMRFEVEDKRAYSLIYIMSAFGCLYVHCDTRICTKNQGEIECLLRLPGQMCLLR